jgi:hypothetical protein
VPDYSSLSLSLSITAVSLFHTAWSYKEKAAIKDRYNKKTYIKKLPAKRLIIARRVHPEKKGIRVLGIAESFKKFSNK